MRYEPRVSEEMFSFVAFLKMKLKEIEKKEVKQRISSLSKTWNRQVLLKLNLYEGVSILISIPFSERFHQKKSKHQK